MSRKFYKNKSQIYKSTSSKKKTHKYIHVRMKNQIKEFKILTILRREDQEQHFQSESKQATTPKLILVIFERSLKRCGSHLDRLGIKRRKTSKSLTDFLGINFVDNQKGL